MQCYRTKLLNMSVVMGLFDYMEKETDYLPWFSVILAFQSIMQSGDIKPEVRVLMVIFLTAL